MKDLLSYTYITASRTRVIYIGITANLRRRMFEHRGCDGDGFAARYRCHRLVWFEAHADVGRAIMREKELKGWVRAKKVALIEKGNPTWVDLSLDLFGWEPQPSSRSF